MSRRGGFGVTMARMPFRHSGVSPSCIQLSEHRTPSSLSSAWTCEEVQVCPTRCWDRAWMFHSLGVHNIRRHGTWGNDVLPPPCWPSEREARIILLRHHELDPLLPVFFSSTIFSSLHSWQSVHSAHFLQHSVQCCAHRCWVPTVTPFSSEIFSWKPSESVFPELFSLYVLLTLSSFSMHPLFHWHMLFTYSYLFLAATTFFFFYTRLCTFRFHIKKIWPSTCQAQPIRYNGVSLGWRVTV